jgi:hypothetical protein
MITLTHIQQTTRQYATAPGPLPEQAAPKQKARGSDNTLVYIALGLAAVGGAYFYFNNPQDINAKTNREQIKQKGVETAEATKSRVDDAYSQAKVGLHNNEMKYSPIPRCRHRVKVK